MTRALEIRVRRVVNAPAVAVRVWLRGGSRIEEGPGVAWAAGRLLSEGTRRLDWLELADRAERRGASVSTFGTLEAQCVHIEALSADWERALDWAAELVLEPGFAEDRLPLVAMQGAAELDSLADRPEVLTAWEFARQLYSPHAASRPLLGDRRGLRRLTVAQAANHHRRCLRGGLVVAVAGRIPEERAAARAGELFAAFEGGRATSPTVAAPKGLRRPRLRHVVTPPSEAAHVFAGHLTVPRAHADLAALSVLSVILGAGAGLAGRLPARIREREGLAYTVDVSVLHGAGLDPGRLSVYAAVAARQLEAARSAIREELQRVVDQGVGEDEVAEAKSFLLGREPFRRETASQWCQLLAESAFYGQPIDDESWVRRRIAGVTRAKVEAACRRHVHPDDLWTTVGMAASA